MKNSGFWIVRTTLDAYEACTDHCRVGASEINRKKLGSLSKGDHGIFYISTSRLHKSSETISEFRSPFVIDGPLEAISIDVPTLPPDKSLTCSVAMRLLPSRGICEMSPLIEHLDFIKKKEHWGSYLMQPFIRISKADYQRVVDCIGA